MNEPIEKGFAFTDHDFRFIQSLVSKKTGIELASHKKNMVYSRLVRRIRHLKIDSFSQYCDILNADTNGGELINFVNAITTNVTKFFREEHHFKHLKEVVAAELVENGFRKIRMWSAGCSMGMEAYSMAMTMHDALPGIQQMDFKILATDIDTEVLKKGSEGEYPAEVLANIPKEYQREYVESSSDKNQVRISDTLRNLVSFKQMNFLDAWPVKGPFQVIFCRNVVIYFSKETQRVVFDKFADRLVMGGWLYIGHSENLFNVSNRFESLGHTIYRKIA